jgi:hypothetical protein
MDDPASTQVDEEQDEDLPESRVVGLHEVACAGDVIAQKRRPALTVAAPSRTAHVPLDRPFRDTEAELEQFTSDALGAPARIACCNLAK